jgi:hypothetical protein
MGSLGSMGLARLFLIVAWLIAWIGTWVSDNLWHKPKRHIAIVTITTAFIVGALFLRLDSYAMKQNAESEAAAKLLPPIYKTSPPSPPVPVAKTPPIPRQGMVSRKVNPAPCSSIQIGGTGNQSTVNCDSAQPPVAIEMHARDSSISYSYVEGGSIQVGKGENPVMSRGIDINNTVVDLTAWYQYLLSKNLPIGTDLKGRPYFDGGIREVNYIGGPPSAPEPSLFVDAFILNRGQPSNVSAWRLHYKRGKVAKVIEAAAEQPDRNIIIKQPDGSIWKEFKAEQSLQLNSEKPISSGEAPTSGWLRFALPLGMNLKTVEEQKTTLFIDFTDSDGNNYKITGDSTKARH